MSNQKKFVTYNQLLMLLKRNLVPAPGVTATLLLNTFVNNSGALKSSMVVSLGLCSEGKFSEWRADLIQKGLLNYTIGSYSRHEPGSKLLKCLNEEKMKSGLVATTRELFQVEDRLNSRISDLEAVVKNLINEYDPPVTKEKIEKQMMLVAAKKENKKTTKQYQPKEPTLSADLLPNTRH